VLALISTIHVIVCLFLILVVLLQQGKGADLSVFGGGGTQAAFGARGATTLLHKLTVGAFVGFLVTTMVIGMIKTTQRSTSVITDAPVAAPAAAEETLPEATAPTAAEFEESALDVVETAGGAAEAGAEAPAIPGPPEATEDGGGENP